jgi:hypothetical protein
MPGHPPSRVIRQPKLGESRGSSGQRIPEAAQHSDKDTGTDRPLAPSRRPELAPDVQAASMLTHESEAKGSSTTAELVNCGGII